MIQRPNAVGLMLCQQRVIEEVSEHVTLVNCVKRITVDKFPSTRQNYVMSALFTDGIGEGEIVATGYSLSTLKNLFTSTTKIKMTSPLRNYWFFLRIGEIVFPKPDRYQFTMLADGEWLAQLAVDVTLRGQKP